MSLALKTGAVLALLAASPPPKRTLQQFLADRTMFEPGRMMIVDEANKRAHAGDMRAPDTESLKKLEAAAGKLPADYRAFVTTADGGNLRLPAASGRNYGVSLFFYPLKDVLQLREEELVSGLKGAVPIASDNGEIVLFFDVDGALSKGRFAVFSYETSAGKATTESHYLGANLTDVLNALAAGTPLY
ncbi:MAG: SMI1/KNR4 family protein [Myxococcaceae bacterium]